jgi:hypothetical protein
MLEERHPAFAGFLVVIAKRGESSLLGKIPLFVVSILAGERN